MRSRLRRWLGLAGWLVALVLGALVLEILVYRFVTPVETPAMKVARLMGEPVRQTWVPLERISPRLAKAVIASEDAHFCRHHGIDLGEVRAALRDALDGNPRGASTITMQVAKNLLLWPGRNVVRKALEVPLALVLDLVWPKARILETYLNIAEWGPGIYGIEAASQRAFGKPAADLSESEAARLAVVLPAPSLRNARLPSSHHQRVAQVVAARVRNGVNTTCLAASRALPED